MPDSPLIQCVPNFSEGRRAGVIEAIVAAASIPRVRLADWSADPDHNRMVVTLVGPPDAVVRAAVRAATAAVALIDLREHVGVHPRLGALDVLPFVPLRGITLAECGELAREAGATLANRLDVPIFFYEAASPNGVALPYIRKHAFSDLFPDLGGPVPHPTAGASVVGARTPLIAYNVNLATSDIDPAKYIASALRKEARFPGVRALGLALPSRDMTQVSMNLTIPHAVSLYALFRYIVDAAAALGAEAVESEVIGAIPGGNAFGALGDGLKAAGLKAGQVLLETWPEG